MLGPWRHGLASRSSADLLRGLCSPGAPDTKVEEQRLIRFHIKPEMQPGHSAALERHKMLGFFFFFFQCAKNCFVLNEREDI